LLMWMNDRICKFNNCVYDVSVNAIGLNEVVMCELIRKKCLLILIYCTDLTCEFKDDIYIYKLNIVYS
jgi:hypothetical protein